MIHNCQKQNKQSLSDFGTCLSQKRKFQLIAAKMINFGFEGQKIKNDERLPTLYVNNYYVKFNENIKMRFSDCQNIYLVAH